MPTQPYKNAKGKRVPSVTTILKEWGDGMEGLLHWAWEVGADGRSLSDARVSVASAGTIAHGLAECDIKGKPVPTFADLVEKHGEELATAAWGAHQGYLGWKSMTRLKCLASEVPLVSEKYQCGGTLDAIVMFNDQVGMLDFKSSKRTYAKTIPQVSAYSRMWNEANPSTPCTHWHCLRWGPNGEFAHQMIPKVWEEAGWRIFQACYEIHEQKKLIRV